MVKNVCKRTLSSLLAILMIVTTFCFADLGLTASAYVSSSALESSGRPNGSASTSSTNTVFIVPETIYLAPDGTTYKYYVDSLESGGLERSATKTNGRIIFRCDVPVTGLTITRSDMSTTYSASGKTSTYTNTVSGSGSARNGGVITWTAKYTVDGKQYTSLAYTYVYRPSPDVIGQAYHGSVKSGSTTHYMHKAAISALTGFHQADSTYKGNYSWGGAKNVPNPQTQALSPSGLSDWPNLGREENQNQYLTATTNGGIWYEDLGKSNEFIKTQDTNYVSTGKITVDRSRYTNFNQIPYLQAVNYQYYAEWEDDGYATYSVATTTSNSLTATLTYGSDYNATNHYGNASDTPESQYSSTGINSAITSSTASDYYLWSRIYVNSKYNGVWDDNWIQISSNARLHVNLVNKSDLRSAYRLACALAVESGNSYAGYADFKTKLQAAGTVLGNPAATASEISTATTNLTKAYNTLKGQLATIPKVYHAPSIYFYVPETIYVNPANGKTFQYFIDRNNGDNSAPRNSNNTTGNIYFKCSDTSATVTGLTVSSNYGFSTAPSINATTSSSNSLATYCSGGSLSNALGSGGTARLTWTVSYKINGRTFTATAYSTVYRNLVGASSLIAAAAQCGYDNRWHSDGNLCVTGWIAGAHSADFNQANADSFTGTASGSEGDSRGSYKGRVLSGTTVPSADHDNVSGLFESGTGASGYWSENGSPDYTGGAGWIHVDTSRYSNLTQIPNLQIGLDNNYEKSSKKDIGALYYKKQGAASETSVGTWENSNPPVRIITGKTLDVSVSGTGNFWVQVHAWGQKQTDTSRNANARAYLYVDQMSKAGLRNYINAEVSKGRQSFWYTSASWSTYCSNMAAAYDILGNPAATDTAGGIAKVDAAIAALVPKTGSLSAKHFSNTKNTANNNYNLLGSDTAKTYNYGDTVTGGPNSYTGYHYADTFGGFDVEKWKAKDGVSGSSISAVSVDAATNSVTITGTANDSYTKMASTDKSVVNNSDNYYLVPVNPSTAYTLKYTGSGTNGSAFIFWLDADFKTINWVSKSGLGEVTWTGTSPANACYMQMRFGVDTAGTRTYSNIQLYGVVPAERDYIEVPAVAYHYYYQPNEYTVTYDPNGGTFNGTTDDTTDKVLFDDKYTVGTIGTRGSKTAKAAPTRTGYDFAGWYSNELSKTYTHGENINPWKYDGDVELVAQWTPWNYTLAYNANGGSGSIANSTGINFDTLLTAPSTTAGISRTGYTLRGWSGVSSTKYIVGAADDAQDENFIPVGTQFSVGDIALIQGSGGNAAAKGSTLTLYAVWTLNTYKLTVNPNGGSMAASSVTYTKGGTANQKNGSAFSASTAFDVDYNSAFTLANPTRTGYKFTGWTAGTGLTSVNVSSFGAVDGAGTPSGLVKTVASDGSYTNYKWTTTEPVASNTWNRVVYPTYTVAANETVVITGYIRVRSGSQIGVNLYHGAKSNDFNNNLAGYSYTDGQWKYFKITRTFTEASTTAMLELCTANGINKSGTLIDFDVKGVTITRGAPTATSAKMGASAATMTAQWSPLPIRLQFHANGGAGDMPEMAVAYNETVALKANTFTRTGYDFAGWSHTASGSVAYADKANVTGSTLHASPAQDGSTIVHMFAIWSAKTYTVTYDYGTNGGTAISGLTFATNASGKATYGVKTDAAVPLTPTATKSGWTFVGWAESASATTPLSSKTMPAGNITLYAIYKKTLTASFYDYANQSTPVKKTVTIWNTATSGVITSPTIAAQTIGGESFTGRGWSTSATSNGTVNLNVNTNVTLTADVTYYASYQATITGTFYYYNGSAQASATATATRYCNYKGASVVNSNFTVPSAVKGSSGGVGTTYAGVATAANSATTATATSANKTFYAVYTKTITFYYSNGTAITSSTLTRRWLSGGSTYSSSLSGNVPTPGNYNGATFVKWSTSNTSYSGAEPVIQDVANTAFYAVYNKTVSLVYNFNGGSANGITNTSGTLYYVVANASAANTYGPNLTVTSTKPVKAGHDFKGWSSTASGSVEYASGATINAVTADKNLYAVWSPTVYNITYKDKGNVTFSGDHETGYPTTHTYGTATTLKGATKTGYTFGGWFTDSACTSANKKTSLGATDYTANITLYALWTADTFIIKYNANTTDKSVSGIPVNGQATYDADFTLPSTAPTRNGYTFKGWNPNSAATTGTAAGGTFSAGNVNNWYNASGVGKGGTYNLYAIWSVITYTITYDVNKGTGSSTPGAVSNQSYTVENSGNITIATTSRTGYTFVHWTVTGTGHNWGTATRAAGSKLEAGKYGNVTLTAAWTANTYTIVFNGNGNDGGATANQSMTYDKAANLNANGFTKTGYSFSGWATSAGGEVAYNDGVSVTNLASANGATVNLYAKWTFVNYTLTYALGGGTLQGSGLAPSASGGTYNVNTSVVIGYATRTGYTFMGWKPSKTSGSAYDAYNWGTATIGNKTATTTIGTGKQGDVTLTAVWTAKSYTITFNTNGPASQYTPSFYFDNSSDMNKAVSYDSRCDTADFNGKTWPNVSLTGYTFLGWYDAATGGNLYEASTIYKKTSNVTLYAHWSVNKYNLKITASIGGKVGGNYGGTAIAVNGTTSAAATQTYSVATDTSVTLTVTPLTGYKFDNWTVSGVTVSSNAFTMPGNAVTLTANFSKQSYLLKVTLGTGAASAKATYTNAQGNSETVANTDTAGKNIVFETPVAMTATAKAGYQFDKWTLVAGSVTFTNSTTASTLAAKFNMPASAVTIRADFKVITYTITFDNNDSTGSTKASNTTSTKTYNVEGTIALPSNSRTGYTFGGWKPSVSTGNWGTANLTGTVAAGKYGNLTMTAQWTANTYAVTVDTAGGSTAPTVATQTFDSAAFSVAAPTKTGYTFSGWKLGGTNPNYNTAKYGTTSSPATAIAADTVCAGSTVYFKNLSSTAGGKVTLTAQWTANKTTVTLDSKRYASASATTGTAATTAGSTSVTATYNAAMPALTKPTMTGYTFQGYFDAKAGTGTKYYNADGSSAKNWNKDVATATLYAHWTANTYTVTLNSNLYKGDTSTLATNAGTKSVTATYDAAMPAITAPSMTGYTFGGYFTVKGGTGTKYYNADGSSAKIWNGTADTTLYALWTVNTYTITYKNQGGNALTADNASALPTSFKYDTGVTLVSATRSGYTFGGWFTASDCTGTAVTSIAADSTASNVTLHAKWTARQYKITYVLGGGSLVGASPANGGTYTINDAVTVGYATRTGYTFTGWTPAKTAGSAYSEYNWGTAKFGNATAVTPVAAGKLGDVTFTANWTANTFNIAFNKNAGSDTVTGMPTDVTGHTYNTAYAIPNNTPARTGWVFTGWNTKANGSGEGFSANASVPVATVNGWYTAAGGAGKTMTLYAQWARDVFNLKVVLGAGGASASATHAGGTITNADAEGGNVTFGDTVTLAQTPAAGYHFAGWTATGATLASNATSFSMPAGAVVVTANFAANTFHFAFNNNTATVGNRVTGSMSDSATFTYGTAKALPTMSGFVHAGYDFKGWALTSAGSVVYTDGATIATDNAPDAVKSHTGSDELTVTLYAVWKASTYTVTFNATANGGTFKGWVSAADDAATTKTVTYLGTYGAKVGNHDWPATPKKDYYHFVGWYDTQTTDGNAITSTTQVTKTASHTLYARYAANTFTIAYNGNGNTGGTMANSEMTYGVSSNALRSNTYTKTGYAFGGWASSEANATSKTVAYANGAVIGTDASINGNTPAVIKDNNAQTITLWAIWNIQKYNLVFSRTSGGTASATIAGETKTATTSEATYSVTYNELISLSASNNVGYHFTGWEITGATVADASSMSGNTFNMPATTTSVTATFAPNTFYVKYMANNGTSTATRVAYTYDSAYKYADNTFGYTKTGYDFLGWADTSTATAAAYTKNTDLKNLTVVENGEVVVYAVWAAHTYSITYKDQGGAAFSGVLATGSPTGHTYDTATELKTPTKAGYTFGGWYTSSDCSGTAVTSLSATGYTANITLYAKWTVNNYTITYVANDTTGSTKATLGSGGTTSYTIETTGITLPTISRKGYTFKNWAVSGSNHNWSATYGAGAVNSGKAGMYGNVTLTAQWTANTYTVTVNKNNGEANTALDTKTFDGAAFSVAAPTKKGYAFAGWQLSGAADYTTAKWGTTANPTTAIASASTLCAGSTVYFKNLASTNGASVTLTAKWTSNEYMLVYHPNFAYDAATDIEQVGAWAWSETSGEGTFSAESGSNTILSAYQDDENYFYLHTADQTRFALGWTLTKDSTTADFDLYTADGSNVVVTYADLAAKDGVIENARYDDTYDAYVIDLYAVWSANYAELESAVGAFQEKYMRFEDPDADVVIRGTFHRDAPTYAVLPAVASADADYKYQPGITSGSMYELYDRAMAGIQDARPGSPHMAYDVAEYQTVDGTEYMIWLGYTWIVNGGVETPAATVDWQEDPANDFTTDSVKRLNRTYLGVTNELVVNPYTAYIAGSIRSEAEKSVLETKVNTITEKNISPSESTPIFTGLRLKPIDLDRAITKEERYAFALEAGMYRMLEIDGVMYYVDENNQPLDDGAGNFPDGVEPVPMDYCVPLTHYVPNEEAYNYLSGDPFYIEFTTEYPPCEGDPAAETHSFNSIIRLCNRVFSAFLESNTTGEKFDQIDRNEINFYYLTDPEDPTSWVINDNNPFSEYTTESVMNLYEVVYGAGIYGEPQYDRIIDPNSGETELKQPSQYVLNEVIYRILEAYHQLEIKQADHSKFESLADDYFKQSWAYAFANALYDGAPTEEQIAECQANITYANRSEYFKPESYAALDAFMNEWFNPFSGNAVYEEKKLKGPEQLYIDGKTDAPDEGRTNGDYYKAWGFDYAEGTLCDQMLDLIDALEPRDADYAEVFRTLSTIPNMDDTIPYPDDPEGNTEALNRWKNYYATADAWDNGMYDTDWLYKYYTKASVDALKQYLTAAPANGGINWSLNVFSQELVSDTSNPNSIVSKLTALIAGLEAKVFKLVTWRNQSESDIQISRFESDGLLTEWHYGDTITAAPGTPEFNGHKFVSWTSGRNGSGMTFDTYGVDKHFKIQINEETLKYFTEGEETYINGIRIDPYTLCVYAQWADYVYGLNIRVNGGTAMVSTYEDGTDAVAVTDDTNVTWNGSFGSNLYIIGTPVRTGYTFASWTFVPGEGNDKYEWDANTGKYTFGEGENTDALMAVWTPNTYTVTFDGKLYASAGDATGKAPTTAGTTSVTVTYGELLPEITAPTMTGYVFGGYFTGKTGTGEQYYTEKGKGVTGRYWATTSGMVLYAKWSIVEYTLTYDLAGGEFGTGNFKGNNAKYGIDEAFNIAYATRTGYTFLGWKATTTVGKKTIGGWPTTTFGNTTAVTAIAASDKYYGDVTLTAQWSVNHYYVAFLNDGAEDMSAMPRLYVAYTDMFDLPDNAFTKDGHTFDGWALTDGGSRVYTDGQTGLYSLTAVDGEVIKLYAVWNTNENTLTVSVDGHGTVSQNVSGTVKFGTNVTLTAVPDTGYHFVNWTGYISDTKAAQSFTMPDANVNVIAHFAANSYTLNYALGGGQLEGTGYKADGATYTIEESFSVAYASRTGYAFGGWNVTRTSGTDFGGWSGVSFNTGMTTSIAKGKYGNVTLTAVWTARKYTITYDLNKGTGSTEGALAGSGYRADGATYTIEETFKVAYATRTGYTFGGWTASKTAGTEYAGWNDITFNTNAVTDIPAGVYGDVTLTANWTANTYTVAFDGNGNTGGTAMQSKTYTFDQTGTLPANTYLKTGYRFDGWKLGDKTYANSAQILNLASSGTVTLTAVWALDSFKLTVDTDENGASASATFSGQTTGVASGYVEYGDTVTLSATPNSGYHFKAWTSEQVTVKADNTFTMPATAVIVTATFEANTYTVVFNGTTATAGATDSQNFTFGVAQKLNKNGFTMTGYDFVGWALTENGAKMYNDEHLVQDLTAENNGTVELFALWTKHAYTLTVAVDSFGHGTATTGAGETTTSVLYGNSVYLKATPDTGYHFDSWTTDVDGVTVVDNSCKMPASNMTVTAHFAANTYTVEFNKNGGSGEMAPQTFSYDESKALSENKFTKTGWRFLGWSENSSAAAADYTDKKVVSNLSADNGATVTLYAVWAINQYTLTVTAGANGSVTSTPASGTKVNFDADVTNVSATANTGYHFVEWTVSTADGFAKPASFNTATSAAQSFKMPAANVSLQANFAANVYTIKFVGNNATGGNMEDQSVTYGNGTLIADNTFERTGYTFSGWNVGSTSGTLVANKANTDTVYGDLTAPAHGASVTLYANWSVRTYNLTVVCGEHGKSATATFSGETTGVTSGQVRYNDTVTLAKSAETGYHFDKWVSAEVTPDASDKFSMPATDVTVTATFVANTYTVTFDGKGGEGSMDAMTFTYGVSQKLTPNRFTKDGYDFAGWSKNETADTVHYGNNAEVGNLTTDNNGSVTLYAVWELHKYALTVSIVGKGTATAAFGTTSGVTSASVPYATTVTLTANAATGYTFSAWSSSDATINTATNSFVMPAKDVVVTATFTPNTYTVTFMPNGGNGDPYSQTMTYDAPQKLLVGTFTMDSFRISGWNTEANGSGKSYGDGELVTNLIDKGEIKLYAQWVPNEFALNFNVSANGGEFVAGNGFTAGTDTQSKMISFGETFGKADGEAKTWPANPVKKVTMAGQQVEAPFLGWSLEQNGVTFIHDTDTVANSSEMTVYAVFADLTEVVENVETAVNINANHYTDEALKRLDDALKAVVENGKTDEAAKQELEAAIADLENHKLTTDGGAPKITVFENQEAVQAELAANSGYGSEVESLSNTKGDISYVFPGKNYFTYYMYTNSANPFILVNTEDFGTNGRTAYPTTIAMDESGSGTTGAGQLRTRTGEILSGWNNFSVDTSDVGRAAGYSIGERTIANPYADLSYAGAECGNEVGYTYYQQASYLTLTPTFVERIGGAKQYALYTFTVADDSYEPEKAQYADLMGAQNTATLGQTDLAATKTEAGETATPYYTVTIFVEYLNNMPLDGSSNAGGQATKDGVGTNPSTKYLNVYNKFNEDDKKNLDETAWNRVDYLYRNACLSASDANTYFIAPATANADGKYSSYVANDPRFGQNEVGSFYYLMTAEDAAKSGYWTTYDAQIAAGATPAEARKAASEAALPVMDSKVAKDMTDKTLSSATINTQQQAVRANCGDYISWPYSTKSKSTAQFYAPAMTRDEALVYVHIYDRNGNEFTDVIQRNLQDLEAPVAGETSYGNVTVNETGGSGIKEIKITQYAYGGSGALLTGLSGQLSVSGNSFTVTNLYENGMANQAGVYSMYIIDNAGHQQTIDFHSNPANNGSVTITVNDSERMVGSYSEAAKQPIILDSSSESDVAAAAIADDTMTVMSVQEAGLAEIKTNVLDDVMAAAPEADVEEENEIYSFILNTVYTVKLFVPEDCNMTITTTEGGIVKTYIDGVYAPVKSGCVTIPGGSTVQLRVAVKAGYELQSLTMVYDNGKNVVLDGAYNAELRGDVTVKAVFVKSDSKLVVAVENGAINGRAKMSVSPYSQVTVAANEAPEGKQFAYWAQGGADGTPVSYDEVYTFVVTANIQLTAVYTDTAVEKKASIMMDAASDSHIMVINGKYSMAFSGKITLPEGAEIEQFGMILTNQSGEACTAENFVIGGSINGVSNVKLVGTTLTEQGQFKMNINNVAPGATRTGRMYMIVKLADGSTQTIYSNTWTTLTTPEA